MRAPDERMRHDAGASREAMAGTCQTGAQRVFTTVEPVPGASRVKAPASWRATGDKTDRAIAAAQLRVVHRTNG